MRRLATIVLLLLLTASGCDARESAAPPAPPVAQPMSLDDGWVRALDPGDGGLTQGWPEGGFPGEGVRLPDVANGADGEPESGIAWYRTTISAPAAGDWRLSFGSAHFDAMVWLDGRLVGNHRGAYEPFGFTLTRLTAGESHRLVVRTDYRDPDRQGELGFYRGWFNWGGLNGSVSLRPLGLSDLSRPGLVTRLDRDVADVTVAVDVKNRAREPRTLTLLGAIGRDPLHFSPVTVAPGERVRVRTKVRVERPALWAPGSPRLQTLRIAIPGETELQERVGLREVRVSRGRLLVNGRVVRLRGASIQPDVPGRGDALHESDIAWFVARLKEVGANATRAQHSLDPKLLSALDRAGILVWQGVGPFEASGRWNTGESKAMTRAAKSRVVRQVETERLHPSVLAWNLVNEVAANGASPAQVAYVRSLTRTLHRTDPGRLVSVDIWGTHLPRSAGPLYEELDAVGLTEYTGWFTHPLASRRERLRENRALVRRFTGVFAGKLRAVTEFGAGGNALNPAPAIGGHDRQAELIADHLAVYRTVPGLEGALIWSLRDFRMTPRYVGGSIAKLVPALATTPGLNDKGLFTREGLAKPAARAARVGLAGFGRR